MFTHLLPVLSSAGDGVTVIGCTFSPDDDFTGSNGDPPDTDRWTAWTAADGICEIQSNHLRMWSNTYGGLAKCTNNADFNGDFSISIEWDHVSSGASIPIHWYIDLYNSTNGYRVRFNNGNNAGQSFDNYIYVAQYNGSWSTTYTHYDTLFLIGKLQLVRTGNSLAVWVDENSSGLTLRDTMANFGSDKSVWHINFPSTSNSNFNTWTFDNFTLNKGIMNCPVWTSYFDNTHWEISDNGVWNGSGWWDSEEAFTLHQIQLATKGTWSDSLRPEKIRVTFTGMDPASTRLFQLEDSNNDNLVYENDPTPPGTTSLQEHTISWSGQDLEFLNIKAFDTSPAWKLTNIELLI